MQIQCGEKEPKLTFVLLWLHSAIYWNSLDTQVLQNSKGCKNDWSNRVLLKCFKAQLVQLLLLSAVFPFHLSTIVTLLNVTKNN